MRLLDDLVAKGGIWCSEARIRGSPSDICVWSPGPAACRPGDTEITMGLGRTKRGSGPAVSLAGRRKPVRRMTPAKGARTSAHVGGACLSPRPGRGVAQSGSASGLGPEGRRFESSRPDQGLEGRRASLAQLDRAPGFDPGGSGFESSGVRQFRRPHVVETSKFEIPGGTPPKHLGCRPAPCAWRRTWRKGCGITRSSVGRAARETGGRSRVRAPPHRGHDGGVRGCSSMAELLPSKQMTRGETGKAGFQWKAAPASGPTVEAPEKFPSPAPNSRVERGYRRGRAPWDCSSAGQSASLTSRVSGVRISPVLPSIRRP